MREGGESVLPKPDEWKGFESGLLAGVRMGSVSVPMLLLTTYSDLKLSETEAMLLIHLIAFTEKEKTEFPTIEEIEKRMSAAPEQVVRALQKLVKEGYVGIDEGTDPLSGVRFERYNLDGLWSKLTAAWVEAAKRDPSLAETKAQGAGGSDLYSLFEQEFGRPLTPMELETITGWLDKDGYPEELILAALKEAVFAGKVHFRYIDRILLEWRRNRVYTAEQAKEHTRRFRGGAGR